MGASDELPETVMAQSFFPLDEVDYVNITPATSAAWTDIDCSSYVPAGATGVILHTYGWSSAHACRVRRKGATDNLSTTNPITSGSGTLVGVDANREFQAYLANVSQQRLYLLGYTGTGVTFLTNSVEKSPSTTGSFQTVDCSSEAPGANGLIFHVVGSSTAYYVGARHYSSTDVRYARTLYSGCFGIVIGCDSQQRCKIYRGNTAVKIYLVGYITDGVVFNTNATAVTPASLDTWTDFPALPSDAVMGIYELSNTSANRTAAVRSPGALVPWNSWAQEHAWEVVACDEDKIVQGWKGAVDTTIHIIGYATGDEEDTFIPSIIVT